MGTLCYAFGKKEEKARKAEAKRQQELEKKPRRGSLQKPFVWAASGLSASAGRAERKGTEAAGAQQAAPRTSARGAWEQWPTGARGNRENPRHPTRRPTQTWSERPRAQLHPREREKERKEKKGLRELDELYTVATTSTRRRQQKRRKKTRLPQRISVSKSGPLERVLPSLPEETPPHRGAFPEAEAPSHCLPPSWFFSFWQVPASTPSTTASAEVAASRKASKRTNILKFGRRNWRQPRPTPCRRQRCPISFGSRYQRHVRCQAPPLRNARVPTVFSSVKQTSMTDWRNKNPKNMDRLQTGKHAMDSNTSQIPRTRSSRPTSTHRA